MKMLKQILALQRQIPPISNSIFMIHPKLEGVYFLINNNEIVYIGLTRDFFQRILNHKDKIYTHYTILSNENTGNAERRYIAKFAPFYNMSEKQPRKNTSIFRRQYNYVISEMAKILKVSSSKIYRLHYEGKLQDELERVKDKN